MSLFENIKNGLSPGRIDDILSIIAKRGGLNRSTNFMISLVPPSFTLINLNLDSIISSAVSDNLRANDLINDPRAISVLCSAVNVPGRQVVTFEHSERRNPRKVPYGYINEDVIMEFILTSDLYLKKIFDRWNAKIIDPENYTLDYDENYKTDITITVLDSKNFPVYSVILQNAYPITVASLGLDMANTDSIQKLQVTFAYDDFRPTGTVGSILSNIRTTGLGTLRRLV